MTKEDLSGGWVDGDGKVHTVTESVVPRWFKAGDTVMTVTGATPQTGDMKLNPGRQVALVDHEARAYQCTPEPTACFDAPHDPSWTEIPMGATWIPALEQRVSEAREYASDPRGSSKRQTRLEDAERALAEARDTFPALGELPVRGEDAPRPEFVTNNSDWSAQARRVVGCPDHDTRCTPGACVLGTIGAGRPPGIRGIDGPWRIDEHNELQAKRALRARKFSTLTDAEVKEVMAYDLTPRALQALRKSGERTGATVADTQTLRGSDIALLNALAGDGPVEQLRPPPVPEVTSPSFKIGVFCGLLVGSGVMAALPYIVELFK